MNESNITPCVNNSLTFSMLAYCVWFLFNSDCPSLIFHLDCTMWCMFTFLTYCGKKSQCCWMGNCNCRFYLHVIKLHTWLMAWNWRHFLLASQHKISAAADRLCQIALNREVAPKFAKWCKFSSRVKAKSCKRKSRDETTCTSVSPLSVTFHRCSNIIFIYMFYLPEGKKKPANPGNLAKSDIILEIGEH